MNEILEECKKRFPIGSIVRNTDGLTCTLSEDNIIYHVVNENIFANAGQGCLYDNGKWAELISLPKIESVDMREIQAEAKRRYPIGCEYKNIGTTNFKKLVQDNVVYRINDKQIYAHDGGGLLYDNGYWAEVAVSEYKQTYFPDLSQHIGRYVKALVNSPNGGAVAKGEYGKIVTYRTIDFPRHEGYHATEALTEIYLNKGYELMPEGFIPIDDSQEKEHPLVTEARRRYPMGSLFKPAHVNKENSEFCIITNNNFVYENGHVYALTNTGGYWSDANMYGNTQSNRIVYYGDKKVWAEYQKYPSIQTIPNISGFSGMSIQAQKPDVKTSISDVLSVDVKLSKKKKKVIF
jgi:hypothetical protein